MKTGEKPRSVARLVGQRLGDTLGQQVIIDNRGGAGGTIGTEIAAKANTDGHTLTMGGQVQALFGSMPAVLPHAKGGKLRALAVGTTKRSPSLPDVPTVAESGYPGFEVSLWLGFFAPKGTPGAVVDRLHRDLTGIARSAEMKEQFERNGAEAVTTTPAELGRLVQTEIEKYRKVITAAKVQPQ